MDDLKYDNLSTNMSLPVYFGMCQLDLALFYREECNAILTALVLVPTDSPPPNFLLPLRTTGSEKPHTGPSEGIAGPGVL